MIPLPIVYSVVDCNSSTNFTWEHCPSPLDLEAQILLPLTLIALLLNLWALVVFSRQSSGGSSILIFWIVALCASEVCMNLCLFCYFSFYLTTQPCASFPQFLPSGATPHLFHSGAILQMLALAALFYRNWSFAVLAVIRFEAVVRVSAQRLVTRSRSYRLAVVMATLSLAINLIRGLRVKAVYCSDRESGVDAVVLPFLFEKPWFFYFETYVVGLLQTVVPLLGITVLSAITVSRLVAMRRNNRRLGLRRHIPTAVGVSGVRDGGGGGGSSGGGGNVGGEDSRIQTMVMCLCLTFLVFETPVFVLYNLEYFFGIHSLFWVSNVCITVDSICNFVSYILTNRRFRSSVFPCRKQPNGDTGVRLYENGGAVTARRGGRFGSDNNRRLLSASVRQSSTVV